MCLHGHWFLQRDSLVLEISFQHSSSCLVPKHPLARRKEISRNKEPWPQGHCVLLFPHYSIFLSDSFADCSFVNVSSIYNTKAWTHRVTCSNDFCVCSRWAWASIANTDEQLPAAGSSWIREYDVTRFPLFIARGVARAYRRNQPALHPNTRFYQFNVCRGRTKISSVLFPVRESSTPIDWMTRIVLQPSMNSEPDTAIRFQGGILV